MFYFHVILNDFYIDKSQIFIKGYNAPNKLSDVHIVFMILKKFSHLCRWTGEMVH